MSYDLTIEKSPLYLDALIDDFGSFRESPTAIKHAKTGRYMLCNGNLAKRDGIPIEDYIGLTSHDVGKIMGWKESVTTRAVEVDQKIAARKMPGARYNQVLLTYNKSIIIEEVFKKAVLGNNDQVAAILGYTHDITQNAHPLYLFSLYSSYNSLQEAIQYFLRHKNLDTAFEALPTREELLVLLTMRDTSDIVSIGKSLHYTPQDVERYQKQLTDKLKVIDLHDALTRLQWYSEDAAEDAIG